MMRVLALHQVCLSPQRHQWKTQCKPNPRITPSVRKGSGADVLLATPKGRASTATTESSSIYHQAENLRIKAIHEAARVPLPPPLLCYIRNFPYPQAPPPLRPGGSHRSSRGGRRRTLMKRQPWSYSSYMELESGLYFI